MIVAMDCVTADSLSCYGYDKKTTPNIDEIAKNSLIFENAISASSWTLASTASLFTGKWVSHHLACDEHQFLDKEHKTLAEYLSENGYNTAAFSDSAYVNNLTGLDRGFENFYNIGFKSFSPKHKLVKLFKVLLQLRKRIQKKGFKYTDTYLQMGEVKDWISKNEQKEPFFIYIHNDETHYPYYPPKKFLKRFAKIPRPTIENTIQDREKILGESGVFEKTDFEMLKTLYNGELAHLDHNLGRLFNFMEKKGILDNTILIITSDHGSNFGEHDLYGHSFCLYDSVIKIPLIIHYPKMFSQKRIQKPVQNIDVLPTLLDILNIDENDSIDGESICNLIQENNFRDFAISEHSLQNVSLFDRNVKNPKPGLKEKYHTALHAIRTEDKKYIWSSGEKHELFDLKADPQEEDNIIQQYPDKTNELKNKLFSKAKKFNFESTKELDAESDELLSKRLRSLGYIA